MGNRCRCLWGGSSYPVRKVVKWKYLIYSEVQLYNFHNWTPRALYSTNNNHSLEYIVNEYLKKYSFWIWIVSFESCLHGVRCVYLAATLSSGLVAVRVKAFADITVAGATHWASPPAFGTWFLHPDEAGLYINVNSSVYDFYLESHNS